MGGKNYKDDTARTWLCGNCVRYDVETFKVLEQVVDSVCGRLHMPQQGAQLKQRLQALQIYLRSGFLQHLRATDACATHCVQCAFSGTRPEDSKPCGQVHEMSC
jgi:hypothetical protein